MKETPACASVSEWGSNYAQLDSNEKMNGITGQSKPF